MSSMTTPFVDLCDYLFLNQQVHMPTRKSTILDLIFCPNDLINTISISDTFISDHRMITVDTCISIQCCVPNIQHLHDQTLTLPIHEHLQLYTSQYKQKT